MEIRDIHVAKEMLLQATLDAVYDHKAIWIHRMGKCWPMWTLGRNSYMDTLADKSAQTTELGHLAPVNKKYTWEANSGQHFMRKRFEILYRKLEDGMSYILNKTSVITRRFCIPGFHIFEWHPYFQIQPGIWHRDLNWLNIGVSNKEYGSFTLPIKLPECGTGLEVLENESISFVPYEEGRLYVHSGIIPHRIPCIPRMAQHDVRITLQGHYFLNEEGKIELFW